LTLRIAAVQAVPVTDNAERVRQLFPDFNERGVDAALPLFDDAVTWMAPPEWMDQPVYCGHQGLRDLYDIWDCNFDDFELDLEDIQTIGDRVVALMFLRGRIKGTKQDIQQRASWLITFGDEGLITHLSAYFTWEEALDEAARS
jgi:ketosteroid isomerase-like protein